MSRLSLRSWYLVTASIIAWVAVLVVGFAALFATAGQSGPESAGAERSLWGSSGRWMVVVAAHGACPCTGVTLEAVRHLLVDHPSRALLRVVRSDDPATVAVWSVASHDAEIIADQDGRQLRADGFTTSGEVHVVDPHGNVRFRGGVTPARGHRGFCPGLAAVDAILRGGEATTAPVYGCQLFARNHRSSL